MISNQVQYHDKRQYQDTQFINQQKGLTQMEYDILYNNNKNLLNFSINNPGFPNREQYFIDRQRKENFKEENELNNHQSYEDNINIVTKNNHINDPVLKTSHINQKSKENRNLNSLFQPPIAQPINKITFQQEYEQPLLLNDMTHVIIHQQLESIDNTQNTLNASKDSQNAVSPGTSYLYQPIFIKICILKQLLTNTQSHNIQNSIEQLKLSPNLINVNKLIDGSQSLDHISQSDSTYYHIYAQNVFISQQQFYSGYYTHRVECNKMISLPNAVVDVIINQNSEQQSTIYNKEIFMDKNQINKTHDVQKTTNQTINEVNNQNNEQEVHKTVYQFEYNNVNDEIQQDMVEHITQNENEHISETLQHNTNIKRRIIPELSKIQNVVIQLDRQFESQQILSIGRQQEMSFERLSQLTEFPNLCFQPINGCFVQSQTVFPCMKFPDKTTSMISTANSLIDDMSTMVNTTKPQRSQEAYTVSLIASSNNQNQEQENSILVDLQKQTSNFISDKKSMSNMNVSTTSQQFIKSQDNTKTNSSQVLNLAQQCAHGSNINMSEQISIDNNDSISNFIIPEPDISQNNPNSININEVQSHNSRDVSQLSEQNTEPINNNDIQIIGYQPKQKGNKLSKILTQQRSKQSIDEELLNLYKIKNPQPGILQFIQQLQPFYLKQSNNMDNQSYNALLNQQPKEIRVQVPKNYI